MDPKEIEPTPEADEAVKAPETEVPETPAGDVAEDATAEPEVLAPEETLTPEEERVRELEQAVAKAQENWDLYLRASAEVENARRRAERDLAVALRYGAERLIRELMPALDSLELALAEHGEEGDPARAGLEMIQQQFLQALTNVGVEPIDPVGEPFDPEWHEAMMLQESTEAMPDTVLTVVQRGYRFGERLIRPARVVVAKAPEVEAS